jgi:hypothetical protein
MQQYALQEHAAAAMVVRAAAVGVVFAKTRNDPRGGRERVRAMRQSGTQLVSATTGLGLWGGTPSPGSSVRGHALVRCSRPKPASGRGKHRSAARAEVAADGISRNAQRPSGQVRKGMVQATMCGRAGRQRKALPAGSGAGQAFSAPRWMHGWGWMHGWDGVVPRDAAGTRWCSGPMKPLLSSGSVCASASRSRIHRDRSRSLEALH